MPPRMHIEGALLREGSPFLALCAIMDKKGELFPMPKAERRIVLGPIHDAQADRRCGYLDVQIDGGTGRGGVVRRKAQQAAARGASRQASCTKLRQKRNLVTSFRMRQSAGGRTSVRAQSDWPPNRVL